MERARTSKPESTPVARLIALSSLLVSFYLSTVWWASELRPVQVKSYTPGRLVILISNPPSCLGNHELITFHFPSGLTNSISYDVIKVARTLYTWKSPIFLPIQIRLPPPKVRSTLFIAPRRASNCSCVSPTSSSCSHLSLVWSLPRHHRISPYFWRSDRHSFRPCCHQVGNCRSTADILLRAHSALVASKSQEEYVAPHALLLRGMVPSVRARRKSALLPPDGQPGSRFAGAARYACPGGSSRMPSWGSRRSNQPQRACWSSTSWRSAHRQHSPGPHS